MNAEEIRILEDELWEAAGDDSYNLSEQLAKTLAERLGGSSVELIISVLKQAVQIGPKDRWHGLASVSVVLLEPNSASAIRALTPLLDHKLADMRECAAITINGLVYYIWGKHIIRHSSNDELYTLHIVLESLLEYLTDPLSRVRNPIIDALGRAKCNFAVEMLIRMLKDENSRLYTMQALGRIGDLRAVQPLIDQLKSSDDYAREQAAQALGAIGDPSALPELERLARDDQGYGWGGKISEAAHDAIIAIKKKANLQ